MKTTELKRTDNLGMQHTHTCTHARTRARAHTHIPQQQKSHSAAVRRMFQTRYLNQQRPLHLTAVQQPKTTKQKYENEN